MERDFIGLSQKLYASLAQSLISFIHRFGILSAGETVKVCQTRKLRFQIFLRAGMKMRGDTITVLKASCALSAQLAAIAPAGRKVNPVFHGSQSA